MASNDIRLLISDENNRIYDVPDIQAAGMKGEEFFQLQVSDLIKLPEDSELFMLPDRSPVGYDPEKGEFVYLEHNPFNKKKESCFAVAAFPSPGYAVTMNAAYKQRKRSSLLPLFSYSCVVLYKNEFYITAKRVDMEKRQALKGMDCKRLYKNVDKFREIFKDNRLVRHLETCALEYGCPAAKNFFLIRYEAPLPTSPSCNAVCLGCISKQPKKGCPVTQPRIKFIPTPREIGEIALFHIKNVKDPVVSFGQGCEGEPLMSGEVLIEAVELIRKKTNKGMINLNTNASRPEIIKELFKKGLNSIRVSMNSTQEKYYSKYYGPQTYSFKDVIKSIENAKKLKGFVSINYLTMPGFTDSKGEFESLTKFLNKTAIDMIQWRNLNFDPLAYFRKMDLTIKRTDMIGMNNVIDKVHKMFPCVLKGYFNPSKRRIKRFRKA